MTLPVTLPVTIIGGYLGAGKTTLLNRILTGDHGQRIAVIVNDFGALNVDASLIAGHDGDTVSLTNGCACCSASDGTGEALAGFARRAADFDRIVIEMSGVAEPGRLAQLVAAFGLPVDGVIVLTDAEQLPAQLTNRYSGRAVARSLAQADLIVVNKIDLVSPDMLAATEALIEDKAPGIQRLHSRHADVLPAILFGLGHAPGDLPFVEGDHAQTYHSWDWQSPDPVPRAEIEALAANLAVRAVRAKGHVQLAEEPRTRQIFQQVGPRWTLVPDGTWNGPARTHIVAIGIRLTAADPLPV